MIIKDVENIDKFIKKIDYSELVFLGYSLGTGLASYHSTITKPDKLLLIAPYSSMADLAKLRVKYYPVSFICLAFFK